MRNKIIVSITKKYEYTKAMLDKNNPYQDAYQKAVSDYQAELTELLRDGYPLRENEYEATYEEETVYKTKSSTKEKIKDDPYVTDLGSASRKLAKEMIIKKYGELDHETNPNAFTNKGGRYRLKDEIEEEWVNLENEYYTLLTKDIVSKQDIPLKKAKPTRNNTGTNTLDALVGAINQTQRTTLNNIPQMRTTEFNDVLIQNVISQEQLAIEEASRNFEHRIIWREIETRPTENISTESIQEESQSIEEEEQEDV